jgi:ABC-type spermidine/putrescine transport system permease subunit II
MRKFAWLFAGFLALQIVLLVTSSFSRNSDRVFWYCPAWPAILIAMAIGGVHSAGFISISIGLTVTALAYAGLAFAGWMIWSNFVRRKVQ